ncbi:MAG: prepilin-type N-terminal cleavage/methylation domain-containing protein [Synergistales bacterium]|nr:prepilin-type N-terminal cleavage/methylation domain-containing protein [Synergistales bacterium]
MKKVMKKRTGFTLVELLIVIIIIGILAGAMLLVAGSGTDKAEATKIVSNLRSMKAATLLYYADRAGSGAVVAVPTVTDTSSDLDPYMDRKLSDMGDYEVVKGVITSEWYVGLKKAALTGKSGVVTKLNEVKKQQGLFDANDSTSTNAITETSGVYMKAR